jgi:hypothetical protein
MDSSPGIGKKNLEVVDRHSQNLLEREIMSALTEDNVRSVRIPAHIQAMSVSANPSNRFVPVPHGTILDITNAAMKDAGFTVAKDEKGELRRKFTLSGNKNRKESQARMTCHMALDTPIDDDVALMIGFTNSWDKFSAVKMGIGSEVFICSNGCVFAERSVSRKHTTNIMRDLPNQFKIAFAEVSANRDYLTAFYENLRGAQINDKDAAWLAIQAVKDEAITANQIMDTMDQWHSPKHEEFAPRTAWSLHNAFTEVLKGTRATNANTFNGRSVGLSSLFRRNFANDVKSVHNRLAEDLNYQRLLVGAN